VVALVFYWFRKSFIQENMMSNLREIQCGACKVGAPLATQDEIDDFMPQLPDWEIVEENGIKMLQKNFTFKNFIEAIAFTNRVGEVAEEEKHHPALLTEWGKVKVSWWSHKIKGLHVNDFILAAKTDDVV